MVCYNENMNRIYELMRPYGLYIAWAAALSAMLGSLYFSEVRGWAPCVLCWYQRIAMYPLVAVIGVGLIRQDLATKYYALPLALIGAGIAFYHYLLQVGVVQESLAPCQAGISCLERYGTWFGFVTIPLLAFMAFLVVIAGVLIYKKGE